MNKDVFCVNVSLVGGVNMDKHKKIDTRENLRVVTDNSVISAPELSELSLNARKLLYIAISQCRKNDKEFYEYETTPSELADMWGIDSSNVYQAADKITDELMKIFFKRIPPAGQKGFDKQHLFEKCSYKDYVVSFKLHKEMTDLLLGLDNNFSKPLVWDFMKMRSPYSMAIWHLMQREMKSFKPMMSAPIEFDITLDELREVTGTQNKLKQIGEFKSRVLDKALDEIRKNCWTDITYTNIKQGRTVTGFRFTAKNIMGTIDFENLPYREQKRARKAMLVHKKAEGTITPQEDSELKSLILELNQITIEDYMNGLSDE